MKQLPLISRPGSVQLPKDTNSAFLVSGFGNDDDGYVFLDTGRTIDSNRIFPSIVLKKGTGILDYCLVAKIVFRNNSSKLELTPTSCSAISGVICQHKPYRCDASQANGNNSNWGVRLQMDPVLGGERERLAKPKQDQMKKMFQRLNKTLAWEAIFRMMWYSNLPCFDVYGITAEKPYESSIIKACYWKGKPISCAAIFSPIPTDRGMCCAFNMKSMDKIYSGKAYVDLAMDLQSFDRQSAFVETTVPDWFLKDKLTQPGMIIGRSS